MGPLFGKPLRLLLDFERRVDEAFSALIHAPWRQAAVGGDPRPAVDLHETAEEFLLVVDLPGVDPENVQVEVQERTVLVRAHRASESFVRAGSLVRSERSQGEFARQIVLPCGVDPARIHTEFARGLLVIRLPKQNPNHAGSG